MTIKDNIETEIAPGDRVAWRTIGGRMRSGIIDRIILRDSNYNPMSVIVRPVTRIYSSERMGKRRVVHFVKV